MKIVIVSEKNGTSNIPVAVNRARVLTESRMMLSNLWRRIEEQL